MDYGPLSTGNERAIVIVISLLTIKIAENEFSPKNCDQDTISDIITVMIIYSYALLLS